MMKRIIQERKEVLSLEFVQRLRKDFLTLLKNLKSVNNYDQAMRLSAAIRKWQGMYENYLADMRADLEGIAREHRGGGIEAFAQWAEEYAGKGMSNAWRLNSEMMGFPIYREDQYWSKGSRYSQYEGEVKKWESRVRRASRGAWKALEEIQKWSERRHQGGKSVNLTTYEKQNVRIEGFQVQVYGCEDDPDFDKRIKRLKSGLSRYRKRAGRVFPWLLKHQLPFQVRCSDSAGGGASNAAATYSNDHIVIRPWGLVEKPSVMVKIFAHEMGHHIWRTYLSREMQDQWRQFITGKNDPINIEDLKRKIGTDSIYGYAEKVADTDPILHLQLMTLFEDPTYKSYDLWKAEDLDRYVRETGKRELLVPSRPVTGYGGKNPEEAFCEAIGLLVAYGPRTVLPEVRRFVKAITPGLKLESEDCKGMRSLLGRLEEYV